MKLWEQLLRETILSNIEIKYPSNRLIQSLVKETCYQTLEKIREVLSNDSLDDPECFERIEEIVSIFEEAGADCGGRHDFG